MLAQLAFKWILLNALIPTTASSCPENVLHVSKSSSISLSSDRLLSEFPMDENKVCRFSISSTSPVLLSIRTSLVFSHRQKANARQISVFSNGSQYSIERRPVVGVAPQHSFLRLIPPLFIEIPQKLNFRSTLILTPIVLCSDADAFNCTKVGVCIDNRFHCDGTDHCGGDENGCLRSSRPKERKSTRADIFDYSPFSSSQTMLIGFFVMNLSFIVFFVLLSICSTSSRLSRIVFRARHNGMLSYVQLMRSESKRNSGAQTPKSHIGFEAARVRSPRPTPPSPRSPRFVHYGNNHNKEQRQSLLALLNIGPMLREDEPEHEECPSRCLPTLPSPAQQQSRKISMPELNPILPKLHLKRTSLQPGSQVFQIQQKNKNAMGKSSRIV